MRPLTSLILATVLCGLPAGAEELVLQDKGQRLRAGASAEVGSVLGWGGVALRGEGRVGYQLSPKVSLFGVMAWGGKVTGVWGSQFDFGVIAELIPIEWFYCGAGLVASYGSIQVTNSAGTELLYDVADGSFRPALDLRLGFATGRSLPPFFNRGGLSIGLHALVTLHPNMLATPAFPFSGVAPPIPRAVVLVTFTPVLSLGFDFR